MRRCGLGDPTVVSERGQMEKVKGKGLSTPGLGGRKPALAAGPDPSFALRQPIQPIQPLHQGCCEEASPGRSGITSQEDSGNPPPSPPVPSTQRSLAGCSAQSPTSPNGLMATKPLIYHQRWTGNERPDTVVPLSRVALIIAHHEILFFPRLAP